MDYNCSNPSQPMATIDTLSLTSLSRMVALTFGTDACVVDVLAPSNRVLYSRKNPICSSPVILVRNTGSLTLTSIDIDYWLNNSNIKQSYTWSGNLVYMDTISIALPTSALWQNGLQPNNNRFNVEIKKANGVADDYSFNNKFGSPFVVADIIPQDFSIEFKTNNILLIIAIR